MKLLIYLNNFRCAKRTSKDRVSSLREVGHSARLTPAKSPQNIIYNSDTVYSTTTFRPVSPSPITPPAIKTPSPQRTRKLETPLHFEGGLFSDIRSTDGKLLSKVTVDRMHRSTHHGITDSPSAVHMQDDNSYVDDIVKTETVTNQDVITVKFTPVLPDFECPRLLTPSQFRSTPSKTPVEYIKNDFEDLQSYKIVNSLCKEKLYDSNSPLKEILCNEKVENSVKTKEGSTRFVDREVFERLDTVNTIFRAPSEGLDFVVPVFRAPSEGLKFVEPVFRAPSEDLKTVEPVFRAPSEGLKIVEPVFRAPSEGFKIVEPVFRAPSVGVNIADQIFRGHSPLANILVSEQLSKIDTYLQESLDVCLGRKTPLPAVLKEVGETTTVETKHASHLYEEKSFHFETSTHTAGGIREIQETTSYHIDEPTSKIEKFNYETKSYEDTYDNMGKKINSVNKKKTGVLSTIYNMPIHYHAAILCLLLIIYNLVYQYIKQNCLGNKK